MVRSMRRRARASGRFSKPGDGRLRTQFAVRGSEVMRHLEYRIDAKTIGVVAVLVADFAEVAYA